MHAGGQAGGRAARPAGSPTDFWSMMRRCYLLCVPLSSVKVGLFAQIILANSVNSLSDATQSRNLSREGFVIYHLQEVRTVRVAESVDIFLLKPQLIEF